MKCFKWLLKNKSKIANFDKDSSKSNVLGELNIECCVCYNIYNKIKINALLPCGHRACCNNCIEKIKSSRNICCPICNRDIRDTLTIYEDIIVEK